VHEGRSTGSSVSRLFGGPPPKRLETVIPTTRCDAKTAESIAALLDNAEQELSVAAYDRDGPSAEAS